MNDDNEASNDAMTPLDLTLEKIGMGYYQWSLLGLCGFGVSRIYAFGADILISKFYCNCSPGWLADNVNEHDAISMILHSHTCRRCGWKLLLSLSHAYKTISISLEEQSGGSLLSCFVA